MVSLVNGYKFLPVQRWKKSPSFRALFVRIRMVCELIVCEPKDQDGYVHGSYVLYAPPPTLFFTLNSKYLKILDLTKLFTSNALKK